MRCPRPGVTQPPGSGGAGAPLAGTKTGREELADGARYPAERLDQPPEARPGCRNDTAMERRGAQASRVMRCLAPQGAIHERAPRGAPSLRRVRRKEGEGRPPRASNNRGDDACVIIMRRSRLGISTARPEPGAVRRRSQPMQNRKPRIVITCPDTGITVISRIAYEDMINPLRAPMQVKCPCGETHELKIVGPRSPGGRHNGPFD